jgi:hypothetical protein
MFGGNNNFTGFGAQPNNPQQGGLFGAAKPNTPGLFGAGSQQQTTGGLFGGNQQTAGGVFGGQQQQPNAFMQQPTQQQGLFGGQQQGNNAGLFGAQQQGQGQGLFGAQPQQQQQGMFGGQQQPQQNAGGLFGAQQQQPNTMGLFGGQQGQGTGAFGGMQQNNQTGLFGGNQQQQTTGLFGQANQQQQPANNMFGNTQATGTGLFGGASNTANSAFLGQQQPQQQSPFNATPAFGSTANTSIFGGGQNQQANTTSLFGGQQQQQQPTTGGLFNTFAPQQQQQQQQQQQTGLFQQGSPNTGSNNLFGATTFNSPAGTSNNKLGGTTWGVPTNLNTSPSIATTSVGTQVQPVKSKNSKLDAKHLVKCIAALDQFNGLSKEEIRINFIQSGGQQPPITQQPGQQPATGFGTTAGFKPVGNTGFGAQTSLPSFGGIASNNNIAQGTSLFGQTQPAGQTLFGQQQQAKPAFGATTGAFNQAGQGTSLFGQQPAQQGTSLFGATQPQQQATSLFGQQPAATGTSLFGQTTGFGQATTQPMTQPGTSLFGATQPAQSSLFGQTAQQPATSLFGQQPQQQQTSLFGQTTQPTSLFGQPQQQQSTLQFGGQPATTSLFGQPQAVAPTQFGAQNPSLFTPQPVAPAQTGFFNQPPATFAQLSNPLFQAPAGLDPTLQLLLPQLLLSYAINQPLAQQGQGSTDPNTNPAFDLLNKLTVLVNQLNPNQNQNQSSTTSAAATTPFDELMKEARTDRLSQQKKETEAVSSLFSDFEKEPGYYLETAAYPIYEPKKREESFSIHSIHKVPKKQDSMLSNDKNFRQAAKSYKASQAEGSRRISAVLADLPKVGSFSISPSLERLKGYSTDQMRNVEHLRVWNQFGEVEFLEPVTLLRLDLEAGIVITKDNIEITDRDLEDKRMRMTFRNFGNYANIKGEERDKIVKRMRKWIAKYDMREIKHDESTGDLIVEVDN